MKPSTLLFSLSFLVIVVGFVLTRSNDSTVDVDLQNVSIVDGVQIVEITAKGGYAPRQSLAQANLPTVLRVKTEGTFDCSSALVIPDLDYRTSLPPSGTTDIEVPAQAPGSVLQGLCSMGMYSFQVRFE